MNNAVKSSIKHYKILENKYNELETNTALLQQNLQNVTNQYNSLECKFNQLHDDHNSLKCTFENLTETKLSLEKQNQTLQDRYNVLEVKYNLLVSKMIDTRDSNHENLQHENEDRTEVQEVNKPLKSLKKKINLP